ncbi:MAG: serine hydrolase domain-containing protein [Candidatus Eremiobacterota bacterium]
MDRGPFAGVMLLLVWLLTVAARADDLERLEGLAAEVVQAGYAPGVVVGVVDPGGARFAAVGRRGPGDEPAVDPDTVFPLGSVTKTVTGLLLADLVFEGRVCLEDSLNPWGQPGIRLRDLATHTSGLPQLPQDWSPADPADPYADYGDEALLAWLRSVEPGPRTYSYSNVGSGLLGWLLARSQGCTYGELVRQRIAVPLGLPTLALAGQGSAEASRARGADVDGTPVNPWHWGALVACGGLEASPRDLARYLEYQAGLGGDNPLSAAMQRTHQPLEPTSLDGWWTGLHWMVDPTGRLIWHDGGTYGSYCLVAVDLEQRRAWLWLCNSGLWQVPGVQSRFLEVSRGEPLQPLRLPPLAHPPPESLQQLAGRYRGASGREFQVMSEGNCLVIQPANLVLRPVSANDFVLLEDDSASIHFERTPDGSGRALVVSSPEGASRAERLP